MLNSRRLIIAALLVLVGCSSSPKPLTLEYSVPDDAATLMLPSDWTIGPGKKDYPMGKSADGKSFVEMKILPGSDFKEGSNMAWEVITKVGGGDVPPLEDTQVGGRSARFGVMDKFGVVMMMVFVDGERGMYSIALAGKELSRERMLEIAGTFKQN